MLSYMVGRSEHYVENENDFVEFLKTIKVNDMKSMVSFDVVSLFTEIPVDLAMKIARKRIEFYPSEDRKEITNRSVEDVCTGRRICLQTTYLNFTTNFSNKYMALLLAYQFHL